MAALPIAAADISAPTDELRVAIGSTNPVKSSACKAGFARMFPSVKAQFDFLPAASGVSDQPMTDDETRRGACNRAMNAAREFRRRHGDWPSYAVGLEGGCTDTSVANPVFDASAEAAAIAGGPAAAPSDNPVQELGCSAWMAVLEPATGRWGTARTGAFVLPEAVAKLVRGGMELGLADDAVFGRSGSKAKDGAVGLLTKGVMDRAAYYEHAMVLALIPFVSAEHY